MNLVPKELHIIAYQDFNSLAHNSESLQSADPSKILWRRAPKGATIDLYDEGCAREEDGILKMASELLPNPSRVLLDEMRERKPEIEANLGIDHLVVHDPLPVFKRQEASERIRGIIQNTGDSALCLCFGIGEKATPWMNKSFVPPDSLSLFTDALLKQMQRGYGPGIRVEQAFAAGVLNEGIPVLHPNRAALSRAIAEFNKPDEVTLAHEEERAGLWVCATTWGNAVLEAEKQAHNVHAIGIHLPPMLPEFKAKVWARAHKKRELWKSHGLNSETFGHALDTNSLIEIILDFSPLLWRHLNS